MLSRFPLEPSPVQDLQRDGERFDIILMHNSINHLDEEACVRLRRDRSARERYRAIFQTIGRRANTGAILIAADASRFNFFRSLGLNNPICPHMEWEKHQTPRLWAKLLMEAGFARPRIQWSSFNGLGKAGRVLLGNGLMSFFLTSHFCLTMEKTGPVAQGT